MFKYFPASFVFKRVKVLRVFTLPLVCGLPSGLDLSSVSVDGSGVPGGDGEQ